MSMGGIAAKKEQTQNEFIFHPDSRTIQVVESGATFPAFFDYAYMPGNADRGNVEQQKRVPHLTFFSEHAELLTPRTSKVIVGSRFFTVYRVSSDLTDETFQAEAWLL